MVSATFRHQLLTVSEYEEETLLPNRKTKKKASQKLAIPYSLMDDIRNEPWTLIEYAQPAIPAFTLRYTSDISGCIIATILEMADSYKGQTILIAYNNVRSISQIINALKNKKRDLRFGALYSEYASSKDIKDYRIPIKGFNGHLKEDDDDGTLIVFMTCAFFVGIDIYDTDCHLIMVSAFNNDFSQLSIQRMEQIMGRLRKGTVSNTIIYNSWELTKGCKQCEQYPKCFEPEWDNIIYSHCNKRVVHLYGKEYLEQSFLKRSSMIAELQNATSALLKEGGRLPVVSENTVRKINNLINADLVKEKGVDPVPLTRQDRNWKYIPYYLNLDAIVDQWNTKYQIYGNRNFLKEALMKYWGPEIQCKERCYFPTIHNDGSTQNRPDEGISILEMAAKVRSDEFMNAVEGLFLELKGTKSETGMRNILYEDGGLYLGGAISVLKNTINTYLEYLSLDDLELLIKSFLFNGRKNPSDNRHLTRLHAALGFMLMDDSHPFKRSVLDAFGCPMNLLSKLKLSESILIKDRNETMKQVIIAFKPEAFIPLPKQKDSKKRYEKIQMINTKQVNAAGRLVECFFEKTNSNNKFRIIGLYPKAFKVPDGTRIRQITNFETNEPITPIKKIFPEEGVNFLSKYFLLDIT